MDSTHKHDVARLRGRRNHYAREAERFKGEARMYRAMYENAAGTVNSLSKAIRRLRTRLSTMTLVACLSGAACVFIIGAQVAMLTQRADSAPVAYHGDPVEYQANPDGTTPAHILACVRMRNANTSCSGTVISRGEQYAAIVSAAHCVKGHIGGSCQWMNPDGSTFEGELIAYDRSIDVALFRAPVEKVVGQSYVPHRLEPSQVSRWEAAGYTAGAQLKYKTVRPTDHSRTSVAIYYVSEGPFGPGDSGGSVFADGGLISVISASEAPQSHHSNRQIHGCKHHELVAFLKAHSGKLTQCGPWGCPPGPRYDGRRNPEWDPGPNIPIVPPQQPGIPNQPEAPAPPAPEKPSVPPEVIGPINRQLEENRVTINAIQQQLLTLQLQPGPPGLPGDAGPAGPAGLAGQAGKDGRGITEARMTPDGHLLLVFSDGHVADLGVVKGADGQDGKDGEPGRVNVLVLDQGEVLARHNGVDAGSTVKVDISRFLRDGSR